jgi:anti-anti-sigma factor
MLKAADEQNETEKTRDVLTMSIEGELDHQDMWEIGAELFRLAHRGYRRVVIDLGGVEHLDYRGLKALAARAELYRTAGGDIKLARVSAYLFAIFQAAGVHESFEVFRSADEARAAFFSERMQSVA